MEKSIEEIVQVAKFTNNKQKTLINLMFTTNLLKTSLQKICKAYDLSPEQFNVLRILRGQVPNEISILKIREKMLDKSSNVGRIIEKLIEKKLVVGIICPSDKRKFQVKITTSGISLLKKMDIPFLELENSLIPLDESEILLFNLMIDKIRLNSQIT